MGFLKTAVGVHVVGDVVLEQKGDHSVWSNSEIEGWETDPETSEAFILDRLREAVNNSLVWILAICASFHLLELSLDVVEWETHEGTDDTGDGGSSQTSWHGVVGAGHSVQDILDLVEWSQSTEVDGHGSEDCWGSTSPESEDTFFTADTDERIDGVLVVSFLIWWQHTVGLATDQDEIHWVSDQRAKETGNEG